MQWQNFLDALNRKLRVLRLPGEINTKSKNEDELVSRLIGEQDAKKLILRWLDERYKNREFKSLEKARRFKMDGNEEFQAKNYAASLLSYTHSARFAPPDSDALPVAIANRSASLLHLGRYKDCVKDIELAIKLDYPEKLRYKLYVRWVQCYVKLGKRKLAEDALLKVREMMNKCDEIPELKKDDIEKQISQLEMTVACMKENVEDDEYNSLALLPKVEFGENKSFSSASSGIDLKFTPEKGRHVIANRDIKKGQVLFVEKPFAFVLLNHDKSSVLCENCCHPYGDVPIPCSTCLDTRYCSMKCWDEGWANYHRWECPGNQMGLWQQIGIAHLALRVLLMCATTTDKSKFNEVQNLMTNFDKLPIGDLIIYAITATMLTLYLSTYTDFFRTLDLKECLVSKFFNETPNFDCDISTEDGQQLYVSSLLLRHLLQLVTNGHAITKLNAILSEKDKIATEQQDRVATAIYPSTSMMNHSCDPSVINSFLDQYIIIKAVKDIQIGEEVYNCYGPHFRRMSKDRRQEALSSQYCFTCECEPCTNPELQYFLERFNAIKCPKCSGALYSVHSHSSHCLDCGASPVVNYQMEWKQAQDLTDMAEVYIEQSREEEVLDYLKQCLSIRRNILYKYHEDITATLDLIGKVYSLLGQWLHSISYLEHSVAAIEERYGSSSIELANELNKLTDICIRYLQEEPNRFTKWYKNTLKKTRRYLDRAEEIINLNYGPWTDACVEISEKKKILSVLLKDFDI